MELLILIAIFWIACWRGRRVLQPSVTVNVLVDERTVQINDELIPLKKLLTQMEDRRR